MADIPPLQGIDPNAPTNLGGVQVTPEQLRSAVAPNGDQAAALQAQILQAQGQRFGAQRKAYGAGGGLTNGLAEALRNYQMGQEAKALRAQQQGAYGAQAQQRANLATMNAGGNAPAQGMALMAPPMQQQPPDPQGLPPPQGMPAGAQMQAPPPQGMDQAPGQRAPPMAPQIDPAMLRGFNLGG